MFLASTTHSNLNTDGSGISFCDMKEDHETCMSEGLMLKSYIKKKKKKLAPKPKDTRAWRVIAWHSQLWHLSDICKYFAIGWIFLRGEYLRKDIRRKGGEEEYQEEEIGKK